MIKQKEYRKYIPVLFLFYSVILLFLICVKSALEEVYETVD